MTGDKRGPEPKPCGTRAAFRRHRTRGERPCVACRTAQDAYNLNRGKRCSYHACPGCGTKTRAQRLCGDCRYDLDYGLHEGDWVVRRGVKVWVPWGRAA